MTVETVYDDDNNRVTQVTVTIPIPYGGVGRQNGLHSATTHGRIVKSRMNRRELERLEEACEIANCSMSALIRIATAAFCIELIKESKK